jgi:transcriptional regulator with XRE-family HTH domain
MLARPEAGGHLVAFAGARTADLMGLSIRLAGFDIRDSLHWIYGSGFPKSADVAKAIDKAGGASPRMQAAVLLQARERAGLTREQVAEQIGCKASSIHNWENGRARAAGRDVEFITPSAEYRERLADLLGYSADERRIVAAAGERRGDGTVIGLGHSGAQYGPPSTELAQRWSGWGTALKPAHEPIALARKPLAGTVAGNVLQHGTGALNVDGCRVAGSDAPAGRIRHGGGSNAVYAQDEWTFANAANMGSPMAAGRWPANVLLAHQPLLDDDGQIVGDACAGGCVPGCPVADMDRQSGVTTSSGGSGPASGRPGQTVYGTYGVRQGANAGGLGDTGGASRFFPVFRYEAKASASERPKIVRKVMRLRPGLSDEERAYVLEELKKAGIDVA